MTDLSPLIANPKTLIIGAGAQLGVFITYIGVLFFGFTLMEAASVGIIGGADGPTTIYLTAKLAPHLLGANALAAYLYMAMAIGWCADGLAAGLFSSADAEKPNPVFARNGDRITAKLIPRAKSTRVEIEFQVTAGGKLDEVKGVDFTSVDRPDVDIKNFKSTVFEIGIQDVARAGTATVALRSDFFTLSTAFYIFNPKRTTPWITNAQSENRDLAKRVRALVVLVQDGGVFDADGLADGHIMLIGGPRDSFWGYALGTLFIRFFGIFFVLSLLMAGMIVSGSIFKAMDRLKSLNPNEPADQTGLAATVAPAAQPPIASSRIPGSPPEEVVASIAAALHLRDTVSRSERPAPFAALPGAAWTVAGRARLMKDRMMLFSPARRNN